MGGGRGQAGVSVTAKKSFFPDALLPSSPLTIPCRPPAFRSFPPWFLSKRFHRTRTTVRAAIRPFSVFVYISHGVRTRPDSGRFTRWDSVGSRLCCPFRVCYGVVLAATVRVQQGRRLGCELCEKKTFTGITVIVIIAEGTSKSRWTANACTRYFVRRYKSVSVAPNDERCCRT